MRSRERIPKILKELEKTWNENPDLRLGQIIVGATRPIEATPEIFYIEDEDMLKGILSIGKINEENLSKETKKPYWELYPEIIRIDVKEITLEIIKQFIKIVQDENANFIFTARNMMKLVGAPIHDKNWLNKQNERIKRIEKLLKRLQENGNISVAEIGYKAN